NAALAELGVGRQGKAGALQQLRKAGLIAVEDRPGKSPPVTVGFVEMWRGAKSRGGGSQKQTGRGRKSCYPVSSITLLYIFSLKVGIRYCDIGLLILTSGYG